ncbi:MAG: tetratricopeptide repeat protein [Chthoniobacterales bacterium]
MSCRRVFGAFFRVLIAATSLLFCGASAEARPTPPAETTKAAANSKPADRQDDSFNPKPAKDLILRPDGQRKAEALAHYLEGMAFEENGELGKALKAYRDVLNVDPGEAELACRVASLLTRQDDFPAAIDVLKDAVKAMPNAPEPYLQLAFIYAKYLKKTDQALEYGNKAIALDPSNIDAYQRLYEIDLAAGDEGKARQILDRAAKTDSKSPGFWTRLGKLYVLLLFKPDAPPKPEDMKQVNQIFKKAADNAGDDAAVLKEVADYYASSQQLKDAIPLYLRVLDLQPDDANAREKLAAGFIATNQRTKAIELLEEIIKQRPDRYEAYDLLAQVLDDQARGLQRENKTNEAKASFAKAASNYEQSVLINPRHGISYVRLAELLLGPLREPERAVKVLREARQRFPDVPDLVYYLALALRESKQTQESVTTFEEALHESELSGTGTATARFYFDYGVAAEQAGLYDKAADLLKKSIALDPANAAETCNYLGYMWADHNMHLDEAADMIKRALQGDPNNGAYLDSQGWVEYRQGKFDQALHDLTRAAENMTKDDAVVFEHIGDTCLKLNRVPQALEAWQKAVGLDPANKKIAEKIENAKTKMSKGDPTRTNPMQ